MVNEASSKTFQEKNIYDSSKHNFRQLLEFKEVWQYRDLVFFLVKRDITARYKRSVLGVAWTMLHPLGMMVVLTIVFSQVFRVSMVGYPAYVLSGLIAWTFFSQTSSNSINVLVWGGNLFQRIYVPRSIFAISTIITGLVNLVLSIVPLIIVMLVIKVPIKITILIAPVGMLFFALFSLGVGLLLSTIGIYFADIVEMYAIILTAWMYLTPIIYPITMLPDWAQYWIRLNPMFHLVQFFRDFVLYGTIPPASSWLLCFGISFIVFIIGWTIFTENSDEFAYRT
ncbi:MAG: ABC transporter permease [Anaerolineaceae bacterium]|jgi:ABC-2 type transport system permease protein|nr:ABC transporter permease [Anaerolineaceae bacterium]